MVMRWRAALLLLVALSCDGPGVVGLDRPTIGFGGGTPSLSQSLVGAWRRTLFFLDDFGFARSSETTWRFAGDGTAIRSIVARNITLGLVDVQLTAARWRASGQTVTIDFVSPPGVSVDFAVRVEDGGDRLVLAGQSYFRLIE